MEKPVTLSFFFLLVPLICVLLTESLAGSQRGAGQVPLGRQCCVTAPRHQERWPYSAGWVGSAEIRKQCYVLFRCSLWGGGEQNLNNYKNNTSVKLQLKNLIYNFFIFYFLMASSGFLLFQISPSFNIIPIALLHTFYYICLQHIYVTCMLHFSLNFFIFNCWLTEYCFGEKLFFFFPVKNRNA